MVAVPQEVESYSQVMVQVRKGLVVIGDPEDSEETAMLTSMKGVMNHVSDGSAVNATTSGGVRFLAAEEGVSANVETIEQPN